MLEWSLWIGVLLGTVTWLASGLVFALALKRRWLERRGAENYPAPTLRRLWSQPSDRFIFWAMVLAVASGLLSIGELMGGTKHPFSTVIGLSVSAWLWGTAFAERRRRQAGG